MNNFRPDNDSNNESDSSSDDDNEYDFRSMGTSKMKVQSRILEDVYQVSGRAIIPGESVTGNSNKNDSSVVSQGADGELKYSTLSEVDVYAENRNEEQFNSNRSI